MTEPDYVAMETERLRQDVIDAALESRQAAIEGRHHAGFNAKLAIACDRLSYQLRHQGHRGQEILVDGIDRKAKDV